ncbi:UDP-N-acetylglucosamine 1-carboxyvinyltransferase [Candidatus Peregrinibacteria bacterium]|nr:MAG: UDP-N-acetylglucosamine 1-carboxyvinyltransferase [Candidatus Peregrinibacteria bacterium]
MQKFIIEGGHALSGTVEIGGSKNAALPIIGACLLSAEKSVLTNVPDISDIYTLLEILQYLNVQSDFTNGTLTLDPSHMENKAIPHELVSKMRGSIILLAPILTRFGEVKLSFPGGCVLGKRPIDSHLHAFESLGAQTSTENDEIYIKCAALTGTDFTMSEMSVTATENAIMAACLASGTSQINLCAAEPHIQDLCYALNEAGAKIEGIGTHNLIIKGVHSLRGLRHAITSDYLEIGTYAIAAAVTGGHIIIKNTNKAHLESFWQKFEEVGIPVEHRENEVEIFPAQSLNAANIRTAVYPSFATDLHPQFSVLLTQAEGTSLVFETLFEGKMNYIFELEKMGAKVKLINNHKAKISGKSQLKGCPVASLDIRAGAAMVLAGLAASGVTEISNINYIDRGYNQLVEKLQSLGAHIQRTS